MAAREDAAIQPGTQFLSSGQVLHFVLEHGDAGIIAPEQRRTYDSIVRSNVGCSMSASGLTGQLSPIQARTHHLTDWCSCRCPGPTNPLQIPPPTRRDRTYMGTHHHSKGGRSARWTLDTIGGLRGSTFPTGTRAPEPESSIRSIRWSFRASRKEESCAKSQLCTSSRRFSLYD